VYIILAGDDPKVTTTEGWLCSALFCMIIGKHLMHVDSNSCIRTIKWSLRLLGCQWKWLTGKTRLQSDL